MQDLTRVQKPIPWWQVALLILLCVGLLAGQSWVTFQFYTIRFPGANDFLARWSNGCALIWSGENPYSDQATLQTQMRMYGRLAKPGEDLAAYSYPFYTLYFFWPLCFAQPYALAQAVWMTLMLYAVVAGTALMIKVTGWRPPAWLWGIALVWTVITYPHARAIVLGQMATVVFIAVALTLFAMQRRADFWAGAALAVTTIKPQICFLIVPWLLWWSASNKRWRLWGGFALAMGLLGGSGLLLVPSWPLDFIHHLLKYDTVAGSNYHSLTWIIIQHFMELGSVVEVVTTGLLAIYLLAEWWRQRRSTGEAMLWVTGLTLSLSNFISYRAATTSYTLLLLPLFQLLWLVQRRIPRWSNWIALGVLVVLLVSQWAVFAATMEGRFETAPVYLVLPVPLLVAQLVTRRQFVAGDRPSPAAA
jgi:hypothetical protein